MLHHRSAVPVPTFTWKWSDLHPKMIKHVWKTGQEVHRPVQVSCPEIISEVEHGWKWPLDDHFPLYKQVMQSAINPLHVK